MRRFVRSFVVRRHAQVSVVQDGLARQFEVLVWRAERRELSVVAAYGYPQGAAALALNEAVAFARAHAEVLRGQAQGQTPARGGLDIGY